MSAPLMWTMCSPSFKMPSSYPSLHLQSLSHWLRSLPGNTITLLTQTRYKLHRPVSTFHYVCKLHSQTLILPLPPPRSSWLMVSWTLLVVSSVHSQRQAAFLVHQCRLMLVDTLSLLALSLPFPFWLSFWNLVLTLSSCLEWVELFLHSRLVAVGNSQHKRITLDVHVHVHVYTVFGTHVYKSFPDTSSLHCSSYMYICTYMLCRLCWLLSFGWLFTECFLKSGIFGNTLNFQSGTWWDVLLCMIMYFITLHPLPSDAHGNTDSWYWG